MPNLGLHTVAALSCPYSVVYRTTKVSGVQSTDRVEETGGARFHRVNWTAPLIWSQIERTAVTVRYPWLPVEIVR
jgi:hypothetical protein